MQQNGKFVVRGFRGEGGCSHPRLSREINISFQLEKKRAIYQGVDKGFFPGLTYPGFSLHSKAKKKKGGGVNTEQI